MGFQTRLTALAEERRRFGYRRLHGLLHRGSAPQPLATPKHNDHTSQGLSFWPDEKRGPRHERSGLV